MEITSEEQLITHLKEARKLQKEAKIEILNLVIENLFCGVTPHMEFYELSKEQKESLGEGD